MPDDNATLSRSRLLAWTYCRWRRYQTSKDLIRFYQSRFTQQTVQHGSDWQS